MAALKLLFQWAAIGFVVLFFAAAYVGRWSIHEIKQLLGVNPERKWPKTASRLGKPSGPFPGRVSPRSHARACAKANDALAKARLRLAEDNVDGR